jgi:hypothetical protein
MWEVGLELLGKVGEWTFHRFGQRIALKEIKRAKDKDIDDTLDLYERLFKEEQRVASSDLVEWLRTEQASTAIQHCLLVAKLRGKTVGILKALFCPKERYALISYFGIDNQDVVTRKVASKLLMRFFRKCLAKRWKDCDGVIFETDLPRSGLSKAENIERKARIRLFRDMARQHGHEACQIRFEYCQPKMADAFSLAGKERKMALMLIPIKKCDEGCICRSDFERALRFLIFGVYGSTQKVPNQRKDAYQTYLERIYRDLSNGTETEVALDSY